MAMNRAAWTHFSNSFELVWPIFRWGRLQRLDCWSVHLDALGVHGRPGGRGCVSLGHLGCGWVLWSWVMNWKALHTSWFWNIEFRGLQWYVNLCCGGKRFCSFCYFLSLVGLNGTPAWGNPGSMLADAKCSSTLCSRVSGDDAKADHMDGGCAAIGKENVGSHNTVDGRNPAPVDRQFIPLFPRFYTSQVVQDLFHQQYALKSLIKLYL